MGIFKMALVGGVGFLLGSRAGRKPYDKIKHATTRVTDDPRVQQRVDQARQMAKRKVQEATDQANDHTDEDDPRDLREPGDAVPSTAYEAPLDAPVTDPRDPLA